MKKFFTNLLFCLFLIDISLHPVISMDPPLTSMRKEASGLDIHKENLHKYNEIIDTLVSNKEKIKIHYDKEIVDGIKNKLRSMQVNDYRMNRTSMEFVAGRAFRTVPLSIDEIKQVILAQVENGGDIFDYNGKNDALLFYYDSPRLKKKVPITIYSLFALHLSHLTTPKGGNDVSVLQYKDSIGNILKEIEPEKEYEFKEGEFRAIKRKWNTEEEIKFSEFLNAAVTKDADKIRSLCATTLK